MTKNGSRWEQSRVDLGDITSGKSLSVYFRSSVPLDDVLEVRASCGCSVPRVDHDWIRVAYSPGLVPYHLREQGWYDTEKKLWVHYRDGTREELSFSARVWA